MTADGPRPQAIGVVWYRELTGAPLTPAFSPAVFGRVQAPQETELAQALGSAALARDRLATGRRGYAAWLEGRLVAYGWVSFGQEPVGELGLLVQLQPDEAYVWDCATLPEYRGRGLYAGLLAHIAQALRAEGLRTVWIGADFRNLPSQAGIGRAGFTAVADLVAAPLEPGEHRRRAWLQGRPGISPALVDAARRVYLSDHAEVWLTA
jgi:GNAT superfamily N-acetyltransferase